MLFQLIHYPNDLHGLHTLKISSSTRDIQITISVLVSQMLHPVCHVLVQVFILGLLLSTFL